MKNFKRVVAVALIGAMAMSMAACKKLEAVDDGDFKDAVAEAFDIDEDDIWEWEEDDYEDIFYYDEDSETFADMMIYEDADDAMDEFEEWKDEIDDDLSGSHRSATVGSTAYVVFDGKVDGDYIYGGVYVVDENLYVIYTESKSDKDVVDELTEAIGFPHP